MNRQEFYKLLKQERLAALQEENLFKYAVSYTPKYEVKRKLYKTYLNLHISILEKIEQELKENPESCLWMIDFELKEA